MRQLEERRWIVFRNHGATMRTRTRSPSRRRRLLGRRRWSFSAYRRGRPGRWRNESGFLLGLSLGRFLAVGRFAGDRISCLSAPLALTPAHAPPNGFLL